MCEAKKASPMRFPVLACAAFLIPVAAAAAPPPGTDLSSPQSRWYRGLQQPGSGMSCCSIADCRPVAARERADHWEIFIDPERFRDGTGQWTAVPNDKILHGHDNPTGDAVACWIRTLGVMCFIEPVQG
jgi:hypothetical protein